jgi:hypothetical protein
MFCSRHGYNLKNSPACTTAKITQEKLTLKRLNALNLLHFFIVFFEQFLYRFDNQKL